MLAPLYELLHKNTKWYFGASQKKAFEESKKLLQSSQLRVHYDPTLPLLLQCDASPYGVGAGLSHRLPNGDERPVAFASRTLAPAEKRYAQIEREGLAIIYGVRYFHKYLYGKIFYIKTDHKPLLGLLREDKAIPPMASGRIKRWALTLSNHEYLEYQPGADLANADGLCRLPLPDKPSYVPVPEEVVLSLSVNEDTPVTSQNVASWTSHDTVLSAVVKFVLQGWPKEVDEKYTHNYRRKDELSVMQGCLLWGSRVIIPPLGRDLPLKELHDSHPGISRMKSLSRSYIWWPGMDSEIENAVRDCIPCQQSRKLAPQAPLHPWEWPGRPWYRLHVDYAGPFENEMILIIVDAHSKYIDAHVTSSTSSQATIIKLRQSFSTHGAPIVLVSDNATSFTSGEFRHFCEMNGIKQIHSSPYHPATNGLAERAVLTVKGLRKTTGDLETRLFRFLSRYCVTPYTTTGQCPSELLMNRRPRTRLDLVQTSVGDKVLQKQNISIEQHDRKAHDRIFHPGDPVSALNFNGSPKWLPGVLQERLGPVTFTVGLQDGRVWKRHQDHLRARCYDQEEEHLPKLSLCSSSMYAASIIPKEVSTSEATVGQPAAAENPEQRASADIASRHSDQLQSDVVTDSPMTLTIPPINLCKSVRIKSKPERLDL